MPNGSFHESPDSMQHDHNTQSSLVLNAARDNMEILNRRKFEVLQLSQNLVIQHVKIKVT